MNPLCSPSLRRPIQALALSLLAAAASASPGAHGPNGEHLDAKPAGTAAVSTAPQLDAKSELFELVARLDGGELSILIDRFETNEPVLEANVEVESGPLKAKARFHAEQGDYAVDDPAMLKLLSAPGEHPLVITVLAGDESDLLDGLLQVGAGQAQPAAHGHGDNHEGDHGDHLHGIGWWRWAIGALILLLLAISWKWRNGSTGSTSSTSSTSDYASRQPGGDKA